MKLVRDAIAAGIFNDLGSGSNVDVYVITKDGVETNRPFEIANKRGEKQLDYSYPRGSTGRQLDAKYNCSPCLSCPDQEGH